jgi:peptide/nickel transport system substrate-binding protein
MNLLTVRDNLWNYPYLLFVGKDSIAGRFSAFYADTRPFSHIAITIVVCLTIFSVLLAQLEVVFGFNQNTYIEGVIVGSSPGGLPNGPSKLNPLQIVSPQLDKDILELVYDPMIRIDETGEIIPVLAEDFTEEKTDDGLAYRFILRDDVYWHDGEKLTTEDVEATFNLIKELGASEVPNVYSGGPAQNIELEVLDDYICRFTVEDGILPNFFETMTFKIVPEHRIDQYRNAFVRWTEIEELVTVGTGPYRLNEIVNDRVNLVANENYYKGEPRIRNFVFKLLRDADEAISAVKTGQIHGIANLNRDIIARVNDNSNFNLKFSPPIYTQYWAIYFNLSEDGSELLKDSTVREAISYSINRDLAIEATLENAEPTYGPLPETSEYYNSEAVQPKYDPDKALEILAEDDWDFTSIEDPDSGRIEEVQYKNGKPLIFSLAFVNNPDRKRLVDSIAADLRAVGIILRPRALEPQQLVNVRLNQDFDMLLFGVSTFVDPDRFDFFHSSQNVANGGLNISGYESAATRTVIDVEQKETVTVPEVDLLLDEGRKLTDFEERKERYDRFQQIIVDENPVIFLYHPTVRYLVNERVKNVTLEEVRFIEDRFQDIHEWEITFD